MKKKIIIGSSNFGKFSDKSFDLLESNNFDLIINKKKEPFSQLDLTNILSDTNIIGSLAGLEIYDKQILSLSNLKVISRLGSGLSNIDIDAANKLNIKIFNTPTAPVTSVAELTIAMMISLLRNVITSNNELKEGKWNKVFGNTLMGKKVLIIGYGNIGKQIENILKTFNADVLIYDPFVLEKGDDLSCLLKIADIITIHVNSKEAILGNSELSLIKDDSIILNTSRGTNICEDSLIKIIKKNKKTKVWLDVFANEPYSGRLLGLQNVFVTPHIASLTVETRKLIEEEAINNILKVI